MARFCFVYPENEGDAPQMVGTKTVLLVKEAVAASMSTPSPFLASPPKDCKGRELEEGDVVLVPCSVESIDEDGDAVLTVIASDLPPAAKGKYMIGINGRRFIRASPGDSTDFRVVHDVIDEQEVTIIR